MQQDSRDVPDTRGMLGEFPNFMIVVAGSLANGAANRLLPEVIYGHKGTILVESTKVTVTPEVMIARAENKPSEARSFDFPNATRNMNRLHADNFFSCVRTRKTPNLGPELAHQIVTSVIMGCETWRSGEMKLYDPATKQRTKKAEVRKSYEGDGKNYPGGQRKQAAV